MTDDRIGRLLRSWLEPRLGSEARGWFDDHLGQIAQGRWQAFALAFGLASRKLGKADLNLDADALIEADEVRSGWDPSTWTVDQSARTLLVLHWPSDDAQGYVATLDKLFASGEVGELVALYQALPVLPHPEAHRLRAAEGVRTNMKAVFCAVAHRNPYPAEQFDEGAWNQMVLKALFIGVPLAPIVGLDRRANAPLMRMLADYAHERWAAKRPISPELWRPVGPFADDQALDDLQRALLEGDDGHQRAAALALTACPHPRAAEILDQNPQRRDEVQAAAITWDSLAG